jgi:hypothetical protein
MDIVDQALADMREGRRVLVISANESGVIDLLNAMTERTLSSERAYRAAHHRRIESRTGGTIRFATYAHAAVRGLTLDSVYFDHSRIMAEVAPAMCTSAEPRVQHY